MTVDVALLKQHVIDPEILHPLQHLRGDLPGRRRLE